MHYEYLIVGGGMTADAAVQGIRERDAQGSIALLTAEPDPPYDRPPLTKGLWQGKPEQEIWRQTKAYENVTMLLETRVVALNPAQKCVSDSNGTEYSFRKLLLATGASPRRLPFGGDDILYFRTLRDYRRLRELAKQKQSFAIIGGGFIGSELAAALTMNGKQVVMILPEASIGGAKFPADLGAYLNKYYYDRGVNVQAHHTVTGVRSRAGKFAVTTKGKTDNTSVDFEVDAVVAGIGIQPNVQLAQAAGLEVRDGVVVDEFLTTQHPDILAAGDVANVYRPLIGKTMRVEHEDNANTMGRAAGQNMTGAQARFTYQPYFYSDLFDIGYEAIGELAPEYEMVSDWQEPYRKGVIYYLGDGRLRGVLLWNVKHQRKAARALMTAGPFDATNVRGQIAIQ